MIIWGGEDGPTFLNTGGRYNPSSDSWVATSTTNAPEARAFHTAVLDTAGEMIVWGGDNSGQRLNTGGKYNPIADSWTATSTTNAPIARDSHTAVWTGNEMIVWGGVVSGPTFLNTGGRYNAGTDSWVAHQHHQCARSPSGAYGSVDRERNDRLGRAKSDFAFRAEHRREILWAISHA
jgi:N-acetylneuraminic acid mutarotase